ncbi:efflux RND transporter permease subunit [Marinimicrobium agarilyticum]|uniref:efflux RND transporter permease subunit n=1 Tax=Marinimicrobium agarilyticum TaxID=306546 RepID=UPI0003FFCD30|nr:efflux RND transporter permease subunit [Marinimicrobium agarilyticum]
MPTTSNRLAHLLTHYPKTILVFFLVLTSALAWQATRFEIDASADTLLTRDNELYVKSRVASERFSPQEFLLVAYQPTSHSVLSEQSFEDLRALSDDLRKLERVESVRSILNVPLLSLAGGNLAQTEASQWTIEQQNFDKETLRRAFSGHPIYEDLVINKDQTATAIQVLFRPNEALEDINRRIIALEEKGLNGELTDAEEEKLRTLEEKAAPLEKNLDERRIREIETIRGLIKPYEDDANLYLGGVHVLGYQLINIIRNDLVVFGGAIAAIICAILLILFRRWRWVLIPVLCCASSVICTVGLLGLLGLKATVISANFIALQLILTLAIVMHLIVQYREYSAAHGDWSQSQLIQTTLARKVRPCLYAGVTTSIGFASLIVTDIQPVIAFGWMMIIAMGLSIAVSLVLFPALLALFGREAPAGESRLSGAVLRGFTHISLRWGRGTVIASLLVGLLALAGLFGLSVENSFINYFRDSTKVHQELAFIDRELGGSTPMDLVYTIPEEEQSKEEDLVITADTVQQLQRIQKLLNEYEAVGKTLSIVNLTALGRQINNDKPLTEYELTSVYWTVDKALREELIGSYFNREAQQARISIRIQDTTEGLDRDQLLADIRADLHALGVPEGRYELTNLFVLYQDILQKLFKSQVLSLAIVYLLLTLAFLVLFRSWRMALIGIAPNVLSTLTVLGVMGWLGIPLDLMTITIASIAMGIAVDDTIHYMHRYREEVAAQGPEEALRRTHSSVGYALLFTTTVIMVGFSMLILSDFLPSVYFGILSGLAMLTALVADLTLLPVLLRRYVGQSL